MDRYYLVGVNRIWLAGICVLAAGATALGCGSTSPPPPQAAGTTNGQSGAALAWLSSVAEPWNHTLNGDQQAIDTASAASGGATASGAAADAYFAGLGAACSKMADDAGQAQNIARAPSAVLDQAWRTMVANTKEYATDCLTLTRTKSQADLTTWNSSLKSMNTANAAFNAQVAIVHPPSSETAG